MVIRDHIFEADYSFEEKAREIFSFQVENNGVYKTFANLFGYNSGNIPGVSQIPLLPVRAFKEERVLSVKAEEASLVFKSSGTSDMNRSVHEIHDPEIYRESVCRGFDYFYPDDPVILAYTPGYSENPDSSLIWMLRTLIDRDRDNLSRFLPLGSALEDDLIQEITASGRRMILFGAAFGLLDLIDQGCTPLPPESLVIETGGMKTRRREHSRDELHHKLVSAFRLSLSHIHSEYGMCELLSQAYALEGGWFRSVPWMQITIRDPENPERLCEPGEEGLIGVIDLANLYSCSFILTADKGVANQSGAFQVYGRWNPHDLRGCNFLIDRD